MPARALLLSVLALVGCRPCAPSPTPSSDASYPTTLGIENTSANAVTLYVAFGADSAITAASWPLCGVDAGLGCAFEVPAKTTLPLPLNSQYLNATLSFGGPVACGRTKAELNLNNPSWYDVVDVSLVDGFSAPLRLTYGENVLEVQRASGNSSALGVYPLGCDLCVARSSQTPCGLPPGTDGCKAGSQYAPTVPCQVQGTTLGGGGVGVVVTYLDE